MASHAPVSYTHLGMLCRFFGRRRRFFSFLAFAGFRRVGILDVYKRQAVRRCRAHRVGDCDDSAQQVIFNGRFAAKLVDFANEDVYKRQG